MEMLQGYQDRLLHSSAWGEEIQMVWMEIAYLNFSTSDYICGPGIDEHPNMLWFHPNDGSG